MLASQPTLASPFEYVIESLLFVKLLVNKEMIMLYIYLAPAPSVTLFLNALSHLYDNLRKRVLLLFQFYNSEK